MTKTNRPTRVRLIDVAEAAGVTRTVAGKVLLGSGTNIRVSEATAERVREAAQRLKYQPNQIARQLKGIGSKLIGVLVSSSTNQAGQQRLMAVEREAHRHGYRFTIGQLHHEDDQIAQNDAQIHVDDFLARGCEVVLCLDTAPGIAIQQLKRVERVVYAIRPGGLKDNAFYCVELDRQAASQIAVEHLIERGCKRVGLVLSRLGTWTAQQRHKGFMDAIRAAGESDPESCVWISDAGSSTSPRLQAPSAIKQLVQEQGCDGLVAGSDGWGVSLIKSAHAAGLKVPDDVAVMGFNNHDVCEAVEPELSTIDQEHEPLARELIDMMIRMIKQEPIKQRHVLVPPRLVVRAST